MNKALKNRLFFSDYNEGRCFDLDFHYEFMEENEVEEMDVQLAKRDIGSQYFFCKSYSEVGEKGECGVKCPAYVARNGKNGICKHNRPVYVGSTRFTLKLSDYNENS